MNNSPHYKCDPVGDTLQLTEPHIFMVGERLYRIPQGFVWDGASIPRLFWSTTYSPYHPKVLRPGLVHDYLYRHKLLHRKNADKLFKDLLKKNGVSLYQRNKIYYAVRMFGGKYYNE